MFRVSPWLIAEEHFNLSELRVAETLLTIGNGYLATRGTFEEGFPGEEPATLIHGVFDDAPYVVTELANTIDWLPLEIALGGEAFSLSEGTIEEFARSLDLRTATLTRRVRWRSPNGRRAAFTFERFVSLEDPHRCFLRCTIVPAFHGILTLRLGLRHHDESAQGKPSHWRNISHSVRDGILHLSKETRSSGVRVGAAMRIVINGDASNNFSFETNDGMAAFLITRNVREGETLVVEKHVAIATSRDGVEGDVRERAHRIVAQNVTWEEAHAAHVRAWGREWDRSDVVIEGNDELQGMVRFNLYHLLIAAPRTLEGVSIGARTLSGFAYHGHVFWDTEIFMLPFFTFTHPEIARKLLDYRYERLDAARSKARANGYRGAQFPWESATSGDEVTPQEVADVRDPTKRIRIWTGDIEIHISADIAYAAWQYWKVSGDDAWFAKRGAVLILETARFWASRAEWDETTQRFHYRNVIGPDEYHEHVNDNAFTNFLAHWNIEAAFDVLSWLATYERERWHAILEELDLSEEELKTWRKIAARIAEPRVFAEGVLEQFAGYFELNDIDVAALEPRTASLQEILGIEGVAATQAIKQPDVLMIFHLFPDAFDEETVRVNEAYYTPRTDLSYGSSLAPAIHAIIAHRAGKQKEAERYFLHAVSIDLKNLRGNTGGGIHGATAGSVWQAIVFGFAGLKFRDGRWIVDPKLPVGWKRLRFSFFSRGKRYVVDLPNEGIREQTP
jgi:kojibiose phosphorylase